MKNEALSGIKIADFSWVWAGPYASELLSFLGADVVKIESKKRIDQTRQGSMTMGADFEGYNASPIFNNANLNKRSVSLNLKKPEAVELAKKLVAASDVVLENMRPGVMEKNGLGYEDLKKVKEDIIMVSASGFGSAGPYGHYAGYAPIFAAFGGLANLTGYEGGEPNTMSGVMDLRVGTMTAAAIIAALIYREKTGKGMYIDISSSECISSLVGAELLEYPMNGTSPTRMGNKDEIMAPHNVYRCAGDDRWISIAVGSDQEWKSLKKVMGEPEWAQNEEYDDQHGRWVNQEELDRHISEWTVQYKDYDLMHMLQDEGVAAMPSFCAEQILSDPHMAAREKFIQVEHPILGKKWVMTPPWKMSETPAKIYKASPLLGEHNTEVFGEWVGLSADEVAQYEADEVIF
ncbi:MAG: CoA transferase [Lachnospiraceae bacterium]|nr:CoA transferase [Lachnospiraceae bacterium]